MKVGDMIEAQGCCGSITYENGVLTTEDYEFTPKAFNLIAGGTSCVTMYSLM